MIIRTGVRWLLGLTIGLLVILALLVLGARYLLLPNIDYYRPQIETLLSGQLGGQLAVGRIQAQWQRNLRVQLYDVRWSGAGGRQLAVPRLDAVLSWRSLLAGEARLRTLSIFGPDLELGRDGEGRLWLPGQAPDQSPEDAVASPGWHWIAGQPHILVHNARVRWLDESRAAPPLVLEGLELRVHNQPGRHDFSLTARPAHAPDEPLDLRGRLGAGQEGAAPGHWQDYRVQLYLALARWKPEHWRPWLDWPQGLAADRFSLRAWLDHEPGALPRVQAELRATQARWTPEKSRYLAADALQLRTVTRLGDGAQARSARFLMLASGLRLALPEYLDGPVRLDRFAGSGRFEHQAGHMRLNMDSLHLANADFEAGGALRWQAGQQDWPGRIHGELELRRAAIAAVRHYLPHTLDADARDWLRDALKAGELHDGWLRVHGRLADFPFDQPGQDGVFQVYAPFEGGVLDFAPTQTPAEAWPALHGIRGVFEMDRASLTVRAAHARMQPEDGQWLALSDIHAHIDDLREESVLAVQGHVAAPAPAYLSFLRHSPVGGLLGNAFAATQARGGWALALGLTVPLAQPGRTAVDGRLSMTGSHLRFTRDLPPFDRLRATLAFNEHSLSIEQAQMQFLGRPATLQGGVGDGQPGLRLRGQIDAATLARLWPAPALARVSGHTAYEAELSGLDFSQAGHPPRLVVQSTLEGLALDFPPPLDKAAALAWPLRVQWAYGRPASRRELDVSVDGLMQARFERDGPQPDGGSYFQRGFIGVRQQPALPEQGLLVRVRHPVFDADAWDALLPEFAPPAPAGKAPPAILPPLRALRVQADQAHSLGQAVDQFVFDMSRGEAGRWRADVTSVQTAGRLDWTEAGGRTEGPVQAVFQRLSLGDPADTPARWSGDVAPQDQPAGGPEVPAVNLRVDDLRFHGRALGHLTASGQRRTGPGDPVWQLDQFALSSPDAHLEGKGLWRLDGPQRGLSLDASIDVSDMGAHITQIGFPDMLQGGEGQITISLQWNELPWQSDLALLHGDVDFQLDNGRLISVNSRSARLLELLSLQSVRRLAMLDFSPGALAGGGFPFDVLRGSLHFQDGEIQTRDYRIVGPAGTIVLEGLVDLGTGKLDLDAVVVPNLDVSGAAIAAGVAINPVVGVGAFLGQWLLKTPLAKASTVQYRITGNMDSPEINPVERPAPAPADEGETLLTP